MTVNKTSVFSNLTFKMNSTSPFNNIFSSLKNDFSKTETTQKQETQGKLNTSDTVEEFEPSVEFRPVVPLPALVDQKTGEENENVLFEHRAKLLRFDATSKEWKERGLGNIKLLVQKDNNQKVRLLMRREQVMKVCCNHALTKEMLFQKMPNVDKAVTWCAKDFSEGELVPETLCLRFKTALICEDFIKAVKTAQSNMKDVSESVVGTESTPKQNNLIGFGDKFKVKTGSWNCKTCYTNNLENFEKCACCEEPKPQDQTLNSAYNQPTLNWGDTFKPKSGTWECKDCFLRNESDAKSCVACSCPNNLTVSKAEAKPVSSESYKFSFGIPAKFQTTSSSTGFGWGDQFKPKEGTWECKECFVRNEANLANCSACNNPKDPNSVKKTEMKESAVESKFNFGIPESKFKFGVPDVIKDEKSQPDSSIFDGTGVHKFSFGVSPNDNSSSNQAFVSNKPTGIIFAAPKATEPKPALLPTPQNNNLLSGNISAFDQTSHLVDKSSTKLDKAEESDGAEYASEDEGQHIHFNPVIPLPEKVQVVTGEESEDELYAHRAKLFRFLSGEWKERGLGVVKILKNKETGKLRVVMRREQVHKICLNHFLTPEVSYTPKDDKTWLFTANDYSEGAFNLQQFCLRFKSKEIAMEFKEAVEKSRTNTFKTESALERNNNGNNDNDVVFVKEIQASSEDKKKAKELMLPENFFTYKDKEPCQGCRGCDKNNSNDNSSSSIGTVDKTATTSAGSISTPNKTMSSIFSSPGNSLYGTPANFNKSSDCTIYRTPGNEIFGKNLMSDITNNIEEDQKPSLESEVGVKTSTNVKPFLLAAPKLGILSTSKSTTNTENTVPKIQIGTTNEQIYNLSKNNSDLSNNSSKIDFNKTNEKNDVKSIFGTDLKENTNNIFTTNTPGSLFGPSTLGSNVSQTATANRSIFGNKLENKSVFGAGQSIFGNSTSQPWSFSQFKTETKDNAKPDSEPGNEKGKDLQSKETETSDKKDTVLKIDNNLTFAALKTTSESAFNVQKNTNFQWEGAGQKLFSTKVQDNNEKGEKANTSAGAEEEYDPHYEPIVPLPDKIDVVTGEEDEQKLFGERCKLYRYNEQSREWKERGVGEMKILYHPEKKSYRFLLRREQVHKAVLNMLVHMDLELLPLKNSDRAWTWAGRNYAENVSGEQETLAVRFKTVNLATTFKDKVLEVVRKLQAAAAEDIRQAEEAKSKIIMGATPLRLPKHLESSARADVNISTQFITTETSGSKGSSDALQPPQNQQTTSKTQEEKKLDTTAMEQIFKTSMDAKSNLLKNIDTSSDTSNQGQLWTQPESNTDFLKQVHFQEAEDQEDEEDYEQGYEHNEEDYDAYYEEEEEFPVHYSCEGEVVVQQGDNEISCPEGHIQVMFDPEIYAPKILITDGGTGEILADMLIHTETEFELSGDSCTWTGQDFSNNDPVDKTVTVHFHDSDVALQFYDSCETSKGATYPSTDPET